MAIVGIDLQNGNLDEVAESIRLLRSLLPDGKVVLMAETDGGIDPQRVLALSSDACIFKLDSRDALIRVLELTFLDQRTFVFAKSTSKEDVEFTDPARGLQSEDRYRVGINGQWLSPRESQVLAYLAQGNSNKVIARLQNLSDATVKAHLRAILRKINARNRTQAAIWAIKHGYRNLALEISGHTVTEAPQPTKLLAFDQTNQDQTNISSGRAPLKKNAATRAVRRETLE